MMPTIKTMREAHRAATDKSNIAVFDKDNRRSYSGPAYDKEIENQKRRADTIKALLMQAQIREMAESCPGVLVGLDEFSERGLIDSKPA